MWCKCVGEGVERAIRMVSEHCGAMYVAGIPHTPHSARYLASKSCDCAIKEEIVRLELAYVKIIA